MKRILFFLIAALLVVGGGLTWIMLSDTPQKVATDGLTRLVNLRSAQVAKLDVSWTDSKTKATTGFTYTGALDLKDPVRPDVSGLLRVGAGRSGAEDQTGDIIASGDLVAVRPRSLGPTWRAVYESFVGVTTSKPFVRFDRDSLLDALDESNFTTEASSTALRAAFAFIVPLAVPTGGMGTVQSSLGPLTVIEFKLDRRGFSPFLRNLLKTWYVRNPTAEELVVVDRLMQSVGLGTYRLAIVKATRQPVELSGDFPYVDAAGKATTLTAHVKLGLQGVDVPQTIVPPAGAVDAALAMQGAQADISLPSAKNVTGTTSGLETTDDRTFGQIVTEKKIDLASKYLDTLKRRKVVPKKKPTTTTPTK